MDPCKSLQRSCMVGRTDYAISGGDANTTTGFTENRTRSIGA